MFRLSSIISVFLIGWQCLWSQSPHGPDFVMDCALCHHPENWGYNPAKSGFSHDSTNFSLTGQHVELDCRSCHQTLEFKKAESTCLSCHTDVHQQNLGNDCARCHTTQSWIVENITQLHENIAFPLMGVHANINCYDCHISETNLRFAPIGVTCFDCHKSDYINTTKPNHHKNNFDTDCSACHNLTSPDWNTDIIDHSFFPLQQGHLINDCAACHLSDDYSVISADCISCHSPDYENTISPNHLLSNFSTNCIDCHTIAPGWNPVAFKVHDVNYFPIYTGKHAGVWNACTECHTDPGNYTTFTCVGCHLNPETDNSHSNVSGYQYNDNACLACHPTGSADMAFDHNQTAFPLTGAHRNADCILCHADGYKGTPTDCFACHSMDYDQSINPDHKKIGIGTDCVTCHTTDPGWSPAGFVVHDNYYILKGAHALIANDCDACHNGDYNNTPNTCYGCHASDFTDTKDPDHLLNGFSMDCVQCHNENLWRPSTFDHDGLYFPIFSGKHNGQWNECIDCHTVIGDLTQFSCTVCHINPETDNVHLNVPGYVYQNDACLACHPTGDADMVFDHNTTTFPLTGAHIETDCISCHAGGYAGTSTICMDCHTQDYNQSMNPNHLALNIGKDCKECHTTNPGWNPAIFPDHNNYYLLLGAHAMIAMDCASCHNGDYNNTPNTCFGCHSIDYSEAKNPDHLELQFPTDCQQCHTESVWSPSTFNHDGMYFPIYSGKHIGVWNACMECHDTPGNWSLFNCLTCHQNPETDGQHNGVPGYTYNSPACLACHPTGDADLIFDHNITVFPLTGAHLMTDCLDCHSSGFKGTPTDCFSCHAMDFNSSLNPNHVQINISTDCVSCHSSAPGWSPATFAVHDEYYIIAGAHLAIANDCVACHSGNYNNTPNTCFGCHATDFNNTTNPDHEVAMLPTDCIICHSQSAWIPTQFDHAIFWPLTGAHFPIKDNCILCHQGNYNNTSSECVSCHQDDFNTSVNPNHVVLGLDNNCIVCHTTAPGWSPASMPNHNDYYLISGAHLAIANDCIACHNGDYNNTPNTCVGCHLTDFTNTSDPDHELQQFPTDCVTCHSQNSWEPSTFYHSSFYPLLGAHAVIANDCNACHNGIYSNTPNTCVGCHLDDFNTTADPDHEVNQFPTDCISCHSQNSWEPSTFDHNSFYPLVGAHAVIANDCNACHNGSYSNTPNTCVGCHLDDYNATVDPDHELGNFPTSCAVCHSQNDWTPASFDHDIVYPLTGAHATIADQCILCHVGGYNNTPSTCVGCHQDDYNSSVNPNHNSLNLGTDCVMCHTTEPGWSPAMMPNHDDFYVIAGAHIAISNDCIACHNGDYNNTPNTCFGCHSADYNAALDPNHSVNQFPTDCILCHSQDGWTPSTFDHNNYYPLTGAHSSITSDCIICHNGDYYNTPNTCSGCHTPDYNTATNPNHIALGLSLECATCHTTNPGWQPATFPVHDNYYVIQGAHTGLECVDCHNGNYNNTPNTCFGCHAADYNTALNPNHSANQFPTDCAICHTQVAWTPSNFNHNSFYPLTGGHLSIANDCVLCHNGDYMNTPNTCSGCHTPDYNNTTNPNHGSLGISLECVTCHTTNPGWQPALFPIHNNYYVLQGAHISLDCIDCHNDNYNNTPNTCVGCHLSDYQNTNNPDHEVAQFPTDCTACHSQNSWTPATFNHDNMYFPIYSGKHEGEWNLCSDCHFNPNNYSLFSCINCHEHDNQSEVDDDHEDVNGYQYNSNACYNCHPTGED